ncbi:unnamed protein product, partial [marine sediment metagenome]
MSFSGQKRKLKYFKNKNIEISYDIFKQNQGNEKIDNSINYTQPSSFLFKKIRDLSVDWEVMEPLTDPPSPQQLHLIKGWTVTIDKFAERFIPNLEIKILYRNVGNVGVPYILEAPIKGVNIEIVDLQGEDTLKRVIIHAGLVIAEGPVDENQQ